MRVILTAVVAAKLVITTAHGVAVADYPNMERCETARAELIRRWTQEAAKASPPGTHLLSIGSSAVCVPG